jgi:predicted DCC family thiol-disulfide oxidoreductase YuxK
MESFDVIFFDGDCNLCDGFVQFVIDRDTSERFRFASLQSEFARERLAAHDIDSTQLDSIVLLRRDIDSSEERVHIKSEAVLTVLSLLDSESAKWRLVSSLGSFMPLFVRDSMYDYVAGNRHAWFGRLSTNDDNDNDEGSLLCACLPFTSARDGPACRRMTADVRARFLDDDGAQRERNEQRSLRRRVPDGAASSS